MTGFERSHRLKWFLNHCKFSEISNKQQLLCFPGKGGCWGLQTCSWMRAVYAGFAFAFNQSEISPSSTTCVGVTSQPFAVIVDDVQAKDATVPLKIPPRQLIYYRHHPDIPFTLLSPWFYLFGHTRNDWGHVVAGDIKKKWNMPWFILNNMEGLGQQSVTGEIMRLSLHC